MPFPVPSSKRFGSGNNAPLKKSQINIGYCLKTVDGSDVVFTVYKGNYTYIREKHVLRDTNIEQHWAEEIQDLERDER